MTNYREILRLNSLGLNKTQIAEACMCSRTTVIQVLRQAEASGIQYPLPDGMSDKELTEKLYPSQAEKPVFKMPDYVYVHKELQKSGVTLKLLWLEYCEQCRNTGELAYQSTQFNKYYNDFVAKNSATMRRSCKYRCHRATCTAKQSHRAAQIEPPSRKPEPLPRTGAPQYHNPAGSFPPP